MTPEQAAQAWMTYMEPFAGKAKLVGPAITNGGAPMGETWLDEFLSSCSQCTIDVLALHIYDEATNEAYYQSYISDFVSKYGKTTWVTEVRAVAFPCVQCEVLMGFGGSSARPAATRMCRHSSAAWSASSTASMALARTPGSWTRSATSSTATAALRRSLRPTLRKPAPFPGSTNARCLLASVLPPLVLSCSLIVLLARLLEAHCERCPLDVGSAFPPFRHVATD